MAYGSGVKLSMILGDDFNQTLANMRSLGKIIAYEAALAVAEGTISIFTISQDRTPVDTGELRESGTATLEMGAKPDIIGKGNADGTVDVDLSKITPSRFKRLKAGGYDHIRADISYYRMSSRGKPESQFPAGTFDVALFTHENLIPAPGAWREGRTGGTQGKYLESAYIENKDKIIKMIRAIVKDTTKVKKYVKTKKSTGKFTVDRVDIDF